MKKNRELMKSATSSTPAANIEEEMIRREARYEFFTKMAQNTINDVIYGLEKGMKEQYK